MVSLIVRLVFSSAFALLFPLGGALAEGFCDGVVIRQVSPPRITPGQVVEFTISVQQAGKCRVEGLEVVDYLPHALTWVESRPEPDRLVVEEGAGDSPLPVKQVRWSGLRLEPDGVLSFRIRLRSAPQAAAGWIRNTVCFSAANVVRKCSDIETFMRTD